MKIIVSPGPGFSFNPFFQLLNEELRKLDNELAGPEMGKVFWPDVYHVNFPEHRVSEQKSLPRAIAKAAAMLAIMLVQKLRNCPVIWTVHDVLPLRSNHPQLSAWYMQCVRRLVDGYIFISKSSLQKFTSLYPEQRHKPALEAFHPFFPSGMAGEHKSVLRQRIGVKPDDFVVGYLGDIKPYKNPQILAHFPRQLPDGRNVVILVAGKADGADADFEKNLAGRSVIRIDKRLSNEELESLIRTVDVVLLPYLWGWNSGFLFLALTHGARVLTSNLPIFSEMQEVFGNYWVSMINLHAADQSSSVLEAVNSMVQRECNESDKAILSKYMGIWTFQQLAKDIVDFYGRVKKST